jgi:uridine kinase
MNIIEAYKQGTGQFVVLVSGLSGCGKTRLAKELSEDMKLHYIDQFQYMIKESVKKQTLSDGKTVDDWNSDDVVDWDKLNEDIDSHKKEGVIVNGFAFPQDKIKSTVDYHVHIFITKQNCLVRRKRVVLKKADGDEIAWDDKHELLKMNKLIFPYYMDTKKRSKIDKSIDVNRQTEGDIIESDETYGLTFNSIVKKVQKFIDQNPKIFENVYSDDFKPSEIKRDSDETENKEEAEETEPTEQTNDEEEETNDGEEEEEETNDGEEEETNDGEEEETNDGEEEEETNDSEEEEETNDGEEEETNDGDTSYLDSEVSFDSLSGESESYEDAEDYNNNNLDTDLEGGCAESNE